MIRITTEGGKVVSPFSPTRLPVASGQTEHSLSVPELPQERCVKTVLRFAPPNVLGPRVTLQKPAQRAPEGALDNGMKEVDVAWFYPLKVAQVPAQLGPFCSTRPKHLISFCNHTRIVRCLPEALPLLVDLLLGQPGKTTNATQPAASAPTSVLQDPEDPRQKDTQDGNQDRKQVPRLSIRTQGPDRFLMPAGAVQAIARGNQDVVQVN
jgi:hypothetical protein